MRMPYQHELYHYGISGMKWGIRRFQNRDGSLTKAGMRRYGTVENLERGMTKQQAAEHEAEKQAAINSGKTAQVQKFSSELTREEMAHAVQRIRDEQVLSDLRAKDVATGQQKVKAIIEAGGQLKTAGETVKNVYNLVAQANNAFNKDHKMPIIGQDGNNKKAGEKSIEQQTKEFALERMKQKAKWEDEDRASKTNKDSSNDTNKNDSGNSDKSSQDRSHSSDFSRETAQTPTYSQPDNDAKSRADRDNSPKVSSLVSSDYARPSDMHESSALVDRLADDITDRGKSAFNRYWGFS